MNKKTKIALSVLGLAVLGLTFSASAAFARCAPRNVNANWPDACGFPYNCCMQKAAVASPVASVQPEKAVPAAKPAVESKAPEKTVSNRPAWLANYDIQANSNNIHFAYNRSVLSSRDKAILRRDAAYLRYNPNITVQIQGNCDRRGSEVYNLALGWRRANASKVYLENLGIRANRLKTISYGKEKPLCNAHTSACYFTNRRDHFVVVSK